MDWDELEAKAAKGECQGPGIERYWQLTCLLTADMKRSEAKKAVGSDDSDDERPKKKAAPKTNGKARAKR